MSLSINREFTAFNGLDGYFDLNVSRTGERKSSVTNPVDQPRYTLANLSTSISSDNWEGVLYIDNITDQQDEMAAKPPKAIVFFKIESLSSKGGTNLYIHLPYKLN